MAKKPADPSGKKSSAADQEKTGRFAKFSQGASNIRLAARIIRETNPRALPLIALAGIGVIAVVTVIGVLTGLAAILIPLGLLGGLLTAVTMFQRFGTAAMYAQIEGQPDAAARVLNGLRGNWTVSFGVAQTRNLDLVHRAVGRAGIVLVGEGNPTRLANLLAAEKKRSARVVYDVPIYDIQVGNGEGQVPIRKLLQHVRKLPPKLKRGQVDEVNYRLKALPQTLQAPRGPIPKGVRIPKGPKPKMR